MKLKNLAITIVFLCFAVPFVLVSNIYPLYRYGMFAEVPQKTSIHKTLRIAYFDNAKLGKILDPSAIGLSKNNMNYIIRSYYYKSKSKQLLSQIHAVHKKSKHISRWQILEISYRNNSKNDTLILYNIYAKDLLE